ncbi:hypothetical protein [Candidatus Enterovibrio escicola]|uniref:Uncharacterized protein n=1 Tax=Candidatus Enterovibrio escicola TaxID=1927127 RepID=A0A2A5T782_9GAMM|nr:hypothetical protein [Candidatus Enterovibrio escacola]PCS24035.1 hypothetical protein BTN49_0228 [Candidatus Enterovibrio escacola]
MECEKIASESASDIIAAIIELFIPYKKHVLTITPDNTRKFTHLDMIEKDLDVEIHLSYP